ncbi:MAG: hypothetical protein PHN88_04020 [Ignavibacteria bacterium]|nr:hypothetical protein [Ignavibacteria bacterium]
MMINKKVIWLFLFYLIPGFVLAESNPELSNKWINHTDLKKVVSIAVDKNQTAAYCGSEGGLFIVNLAQGTVQKKMTNIDGLLTNNVSSVYVDTLNRVWVGGADGSITIFDNSGNFKYIYDIRNSNEANKIIKDFIQYGKYMYVATGYGIQKISVLSFSFVDAPYYQLGVFTGKSKVNTLTVNAGKIFAGTVSGIAYANLTNANLNDPMSWTNYSTAPVNLNVKSSETFDNKVFMGSDNGFVYYDNSNWQSYPNPAVSGSNIVDIKAIGDSLYFIANNSIYFAPKNNPGQITQYSASGNYLTLGSYKHLPLIGVFENGISYVLNGNAVSIYPNCPYRNSFDFLSIGPDGTLWAAGGQDITGFTAGFYKYDGNAWVSYNTYNTPQIGNSNFFRKVYAGNGVVWALCYGGGATKLTGNNIQNFNSLNSPLPGISGDSTFCVPYGGAFDNSGNFWMSFFNSGNSRNLYVITADSILGFINPEVIPNSGHFEQVAIDNYNTKWCVLSGSGGGLYFFNENGSIYNTGDDIFGFYNANDFENNDLTGIVVEKNNEVWVTTINGVYMISDPYKAIQDPNHKPAPVKLGIISGNLRVPFTENCKCIATDVLNQKWIGTKNNGVFHLSSDGSTLLEQFNVSNSPLLNNEVTSIAVSYIDGRAYFGSLYGLSSVQTDAIAPVADFDKIICSPNPYLVPPRVNLKIDGLVENSSVKIITLTGEIVAEFDSPGGKIASWDGKDKKGNYVPSGIYIVVGFNKDGSKVGKGKLAVIKQ